MCRLGLHTVGNITDNHEQIPGRELVGRRSNGQVAAIFAFHPPLTELHSPGVQALQCSRKAGLTFLGDQVSYVPGQHFFARVAGELAAHLVDLHQVTVRVGHKYTDARLLHQYLVAFLALQAALYTLFFQCDVMVVAHHSCHFRLSEQICQGCFHPAPVAIGVAQSTLKGDAVAGPVKQSGKLLPQVFQVIGMQQRQAFPAHQLFGGVAGDALSGRTGIGHDALRVRSAMASLLCSMSAWKRWSLCRDTPFDICLFPLCVAQAVEKLQMS